MRDLVTTLLELAAVLLVAAAAGLCAAGELRPGYGCAAAGAVLALGSAAVVRAEQRQRATAEDVAE